MATSNAHVADVFDELAERLALTEEQPYRYLAYRKAAAAIRAAPTSVEQMVQQGKVRQLPGVGEAIATKIAQLVESGTFQELERARAAVPDGLVRLAGVPGIGRATAVRVWGAFDAREWDDIVAAARDGALVRIPGVGQATADAVLAAASADAVPDDVPAPAPRLLRDQVEDLGSAVARLLEERVAGIDSVAVAGPHARGFVLSDSVDLLVVAHGDPYDTLRTCCDALEAAGWALRDAASAYDGAPAWLHAALVAPNLVVVGLFVATPASAAAARLHAIGPPEYATAGGPAWVAPELRDRPEALTRPHALPAPLITTGDLLAELHCHTTSSDGRNTVLAMARAAHARGDTHMAITDHSAPFAMVNGLGPERLREQAAEIDLANTELAGEFVVLKGSEVEVLADGTLGLPDEVLGQLDWVVASVHVDQRQPAAEMTARVERVLRHPLVDCLGHPTGRLLTRRGSSNLDVERLVELAAETGTVLEVNANPRRLDLGPAHARLALEAGVLLAIDTDAHGVDTLDMRTHGVAVARRAAATSAQVVNCLPLESLREGRKRWR